MSLLDKEGEWFYDKITGDLYVWLATARPKRQRFVDRGTMAQKGTFGWDYLLTGNNARNFHFEV